MAMQEFGPKVNAYCIGNLLHVIRDTAIETKVARASQLRMLVRYHPVKKWSLVYIFRKVGDKQE